MGRVVGEVISSSSPFTTAPFTEDQGVCKITALGSLYAFLRYLRVTIIQEEVVEVTKRVDKWGLVACVSFSFSLFSATFFFAYRSSLIGLRIVAFIDTCGSSSSTMS